jgi:hypothetical protein
MSKLCSFKLLPISLIVLISGGAVELTGQRLSRDMNVELLVNHVGFVPESGKTVVTRGLRNSMFEVINTSTHEVVYTGSFKPNPGDFGEYSTGDFSSVTKEGHYYLKADTLRSYPFSIAKTVYRPVMDLIIGYFSLQRCGASSTGYLAPCHLDDGIRMDNGKHQDVTGGWHDASDLRKWVAATIFGMYGLGKTYQLMDEKDPGLVKILDELKWGNLYFLKMQEPQGYIMNFVGGDAKKHSDSNRWTDNIIVEEAGELAFVKPNAGRSTQDMLIFGTSDDRVIRTDPANMLTQYIFITSEAIMANITKTKEPDYSKKCLQAAVSCFEWCKKSSEDMNSGTIGASIQAAIELYKVTGQEVYRTFAVEKAQKLRNLQAKQENGIGGFFYTSVTNREPYKNISRGCLDFISLCDLIREFPNHKDASLWKEIIKAYANQYLFFMSQKNSFGIIPYGLFNQQDTIGNKKVGNYWYRYFDQPERLGINANLAAAGIGLMKAAGILNDPKLKDLAQRQLDWIIGVNPFNSSTIVMVGYNNPKPFNSSEFKPFTPLLPGAVMNGLRGDRADQPDIGNGNWQVSEYWTPMVCYTLWLTAQISKTK